MGVIQEGVQMALRLFQETRNQVVHGRQRATDDEVIRAIDAGLTILAAILNVPRERHYVNAIGLPLFADPGGTEPVPEGTGVRLRSERPPGQGTITRIFPTTRGHFVVGEEVAWEWNAERQWGPCWYRDPSDGDVKEAWRGSLEFVGRNIRDL
jgi:hypothetical protein